MPSVPLSTELQAPNEAWLVICFANYSVATYKKTFTWLEKVKAEAQVVWLHYLL